MVNRAIMFVPINNPRFVDKAWTRGADAIILDLEDSIPMAEKVKARSLVRETISNVAKGGASVFVRINKEFIEADLRAAIWPGIRRVIQPKVESGDEVRLVDSLLTMLEKERGIPIGTVEIFPLLESSVGVVNSYEIARSSQRIKTMGDAGGGYDTALDLEIEMFADFDQYSYMREEPCLAAMAAGVEPVGLPFVPGATGRVNQADEGAALARSLGRLGIQEAIVLHPAFVEPLVSGLVPADSEVQWARRVVEIYEHLEEDGENLTEVDGRVVDVYEYRHSLRLLQWAADCAKRDALKARAASRSEPEVQSKG